jgi:hypothetical protein
VLLSNIAVQLSPLGTFAELEYIGVVPFPNKNVGKLVGLHESQLNSALYMFERALVTNWLDFFSEPWVSAVLHNKFEQCISSLEESIKADKYVMSVLETFAEKATLGVDDSTLSSARRQVLGDRTTFAPDSVKNAIEIGILEYLKKHNSDLPSFYIPSGNRSKK